MASARPQVVQYWIRPRIISATPSFAIPRSPDISKRTLTGGILAFATLLAAALEGPASATTWDVPAVVPSIAAALDSAAAGDTVLVACGTWFEHGLILKSGVTLRGATGDPACATIDGQQLGRVLDGAGLDSSTRLEGFTITGGVAVTGPYWENAGAGIRLTDSEARITDCVFTGNHSKYGGGVAITGGAPRLTDCRFTGNIAQAEDWAAGGGLYAKDSVPQLLRCTFETNDASANVTPADGGGIFADRTRLFVKDCVFDGNTADAGAGGFYSFRSDMSRLEDCTFTGNVATAGGAMYVETSLPSVVRTTFRANQAVNGGAQFIAKRSSPSFVDCLFEGNRATPNAGGAVDCWTSSPTFTRCDLVDNETDSRGGAVSLNESSSIDMVDCLLARNRAGTDGGAIRANDLASLTGSGCTLVANEAGGTGGAIHAEEGASVDLTHSLVAFSGLGEAASCATGGTVTLTCSDVWGNAGGDWTGCLSGQSGAGGNLEVDPQLCGLADSVYTVRLPDSPMLPENNSCGARIGRFGGGCGCPTGATLLVPGDHPTIAAALAAAVPGDIVGVCDGVWEEAIELREGVHLLGVRSDLAIIAWPPAGPTGALVHAAGVVDSTVVAGLGLDAGGAAAFVVEAESTSTGLHLRNDVVTGGAIGGIRVGPDSRLVLGGSLETANDLLANGSAVLLHLRNENTTADSLEARFNWWGTTLYYDEILPAIEGLVLTCPITDSTHSDTLCAPPEAVSTPVAAPGPGRLRLAAGPNPFRAGTRISFAVPRPGRVRLSVHDVRGRRVADLWNGPGPAAGRHTVRWDGRDTGGRAVAPGVYFLRLEAGGEFVTRKMVHFR